MMSPVTTQRGIALVMVLWLVVLLGVIATSHARNARIETRLAFNQSELIKARARAEAGVNRAIMELLRRDTETHWPVDGTVTRFNFYGGSVMISIRNASGLVDLNNASPDTLDKLLGGMNVEESLRQQLVDATLDWRDKDNLRHLNGAEDSDYRHAGVDWTSRDGALVSVDEWRYVMGMTRSLFNRLAPYLTVHSGQASVDLDFAPPWLARALSGSDTGSEQNATEAEATGTSRQSRGSGTYHITVQARGSGATAASLEVVVKIAAASDTPYSILSWREPARQIATPPAITDGGAQTRL